MKVGIVQLYVNTANQFMFLDQNRISSAVELSLYFASLLEFDKFLEARAKVADAASPSPPRGEPSVPASAPSSSRKKAERTEDNLFAL